MSTSDWLRNARGEWFVIAQTALMLAVLVAPKLDGRNVFWSGITGAAGGLLCIVGLGFVVLGSIALGRNLSPFPQAKREGDPGRKRDLLSGTPSNLQRLQPSRLRLESALEQHCYSHRRAAAAAGVFRHQGTTRRALARRKIHWLRSIQIASQETHSIRLLTPNCGPSAGWRAST